MMDKDFFDEDILRQKLAKSGKFAELFKTYTGDYAEVSDISTAEKWDNLSGMGNVPEVRIKRLERVEKLIDTNKKILDVGVGWGDIVPLLCKSREGIDYTGIDFSAEIIKSLSVKYPKHTFKTTTVDNLDGEYDYVLVLEVLEHIVPSKTFSFLAEVIRVLSDNGVLIVTVPLNEDLKSNTFVCGKCGSFVNRMGHVRSYSIELIMAELERAGFFVIHTELIFEGYYGLKGTVKRYLRNIAGHLLGPSGFRPVLPVCVILKCYKFD